MSVYLILNIIYGHSVRLQLDLLKAAGINEWLKLNTTGMNEDF